MNYESRTKQSLRVSSVVENKNIFKILTRECSFSRYIEQIMSNFITVNIAVP